MKYFIKIGIIICFSPCFGTVQFQDITQKNYLKIYAATILCELELELPICEPLEIYKVAKAEYDQAIDEGTEKWEELQERGQEIFDSEVEPYFKTVCENRDTIPSYLLPICELSDVINAAEDSQSQGSMEGALFQPAFDLQGHQGFKRIHHYELHFTEMTYTRMINIIIGIACDKGQEIAMSYCEYTEQIKAHDREFYEPKRIALRNAESELNSQIDVVCSDIDKDKPHIIPFYIEVLCRDEA